MSATRVVEMKDGEKGLLALAVVGDYIYWSKTETKKTNIMTPAGVKPDGDYSDSPYKLGSDGKWGNEASIYTPAPKRGGIHNALKPVASSVPRERPLKLMNVTQGEMMATFSKADQKLVREGGGRMNENSESK